MCAPETHARTHARTTESDDTTVGRRFRRRRSRAVAALRLRLCHRDERNERRRPRRKKAMGGHCDDDDDDDDYGRQHCASSNDLRRDLDSILGRARTRSRDRGTSEERRHREDATINRNSRAERTSVRYQRCARVALSAISRLAFSPTAIFYADLRGFYALPIRTSNNFQAIGRAAASGIGSTSSTLPPPIPIPLTWAGR
ncbi:hypothetical protein ACHAWF_012965 [Thalassiosira exigua]